MKIIFIPISLSGYLLDSASERFRCRWLAPYLNADIYDRTQILDDYDVIIYNKGHYPIEFRNLAKKYKNKLQILDTTDPDWLFYPKEFQEMANCCRFLTASTPELAEEMKRFGDSYCIPDRQELGFYKIKKVHQDASPGFVWFGYSNNFRHVTDLVRKGLTLEERETRLWIISDRAVGEGLFVKWDLQTFCDDVIQGDIVLNAKARFKSNNKTTTAWALSMPVAMSVEEIDRFRNYEERRNEAERRLKEVKEKWDIKISAEEFKSLIRRYT